MKSYLQRLSLAPLLLAAFSVCLMAQQMEAASEGLVAESLGTLFDRQVYFPLEVGNEWIYTDGTNTFRVQVLTQAREANGRTYFQVAGYFQEDSVKVRKLRRDLWGQVFEYNPRGADFLWYQLFSFGLNSPATWTFETGDDLTCIRGSSLSTAGRFEPLVVPAGTFPSAIRVDHRSRCADAGLQSEYFAPGVGLIKRVMNTIAGPRSLDLVAARVGSSQLPAIVFAVQVSVDRPIYFNNRMPPVSDPSPTMQAQLTVRNDTQLAVDFQFSTAQRFDFVVRDAAGKEVLRWSKGKAFPQVVGRETLANGRLIYPATLELQGSDGKPLPAGVYTLEGFLTTSGFPAAQGSIAFQLRDTF